MSAHNQVFCCIFESPILYKVLLGVLVAMDHPYPDPTVALPPLAIKKGNLTSEERRIIVTILLSSIKPDDPEVK